MNSCPKPFLFPVLLVVGLLLTASSLLKGEPPAPPSGNQGYLGISYQDSPQDLARENKLADNKGVLIANVSRESPAAAAGLKAQDIIVEFDGSEIADRAGFAAMIRQSPPGKRVAIKFVRGGQADATIVTVGTMPPSVAYALRGDEKLNKRDWPGAIADYTEAIRLDPQSPYSFLNRSEAKRQIHDWDGVIADCTETIRLDPSNAVAYYYRGAAKTGCSDWDGAIADETEAIRLNPKLANSYYLRGWAKHNKGDFDGATADYTTKIGLDPEDPDAYLNRGLCRAKNVNRDSGRKLRKSEAAAAQKRSAEATADFQEAIRRYTERIARNPNDFCAYTYRASAKEQLGDTSGAARDRAESARVEAQVILATFREEIARASLPDLLVSSDKTESQARERNRALVAAKNQQLPAILREKKTEELSDLAVKIEQTILDLNHECEVTKDRAQQSVAGETGSQTNLDELRGLAISYRERIELLKPILTALKEEIANRNR